MCNGTDIDLTASSGSGMLNSYRVFIALQNVLFIFSFEILFSFLELLVLILERIPAAIIYIII